MISLIRSDVPVRDYNELISLYPANEFRSPLRSTVPSIGFWKNHQKEINSIFSENLITEMKDYTLHFEYGVPVQLGAGLPSRTDLMILGESFSACIEAKYTEEIDHSVLNWLGAPANENRMMVLEGWLNLIRNCTDNEIHVDAILELPYQLVHRVASACYPDTQTKLVVYQLFDHPREKQAEYARYLTMLSELMGDHTALIFRILSCKVLKSDEYRDLTNRWHQGERDLSPEVVQGLLGGTMIDAQIDNFITV